MLNPSFIELHSWMFCSDSHHCFSFHSPPLFLAISQSITSLFFLNTSASDSNMWLQHRFWIQWLISKLKSVKDSLEIWCLCVMFR